MEIRGERRCQDCDTRWSYFDTGSVTCPECGSIRSVGVTDRTLHTDSSGALDLTVARRALASGPLEDAADRAREQAGEYVRRRGFIQAGEFQPLDDTFLGAIELREVSRTLSRSLHVDDEAELYFLTLLEDVPNGTRPAPADVPSTLTAARGLGIESAVDAYLTDLGQWLDTRESTPPNLTSIIGRLRDHRRRIAALDGDVSPTDAERLVTATRAVADYAQNGDFSDLEQARAALDGID